MLGVLNICGILIRNCCNWIGDAGYECLFINITNLLNRFISINGHLMAFYIAINLPA